MLTEVATPEAYARIERLRTRLETEISAVIAEYGLPWHVVTAGAKGCIAFRDEPIRNYRDFLDVFGELGEAHWLVQHNGGVFLPPWGKIEQWLLSVQHGDDDVDRFVANVRRLAELVTTDS
jgi:glutamate-1-semialdehyde 2,1-aminomutase